MKRALLVLHEYSQVGLPAGSSYVRLLAPLSRPEVMDAYNVYPLPVDPGEAYHLAILDRYWRPDITPALAEQAVASLRQRGARVILQVDDDLLVLPVTDDDSQRRQDAIRLLLQQVDQVMTSTPALAEGLAPFNPQVSVVRNALDDRLLPLLPAGIAALSDTAVARPITLGYMGTHTHDADLRMILPALAQLPRSTSRLLRLQIVGGVAHDDTRQALADLPFPVQFVRAPAEQYPLFMNWFWHSLGWDIALAPLVDTRFNRCKSDLKFLDYAALGAAGIYSDLPVYASIADGVTGLRVANETDAWAEGLLRLIREPELRRTLAVNAHAYLRRERTLSTQIGQWLALLEAS